MGDYVGDPYPYAKFHHVTRVVFLVLPSAYSQDPCTDFADQYVK